MEMITGIKLYKDNIPETDSILPIAFHLIARAGTLTTLISLIANYQTINILTAIIINIIIVFIVLKITSRL